MSEVSWGDGVTIIGFDLGHGETSIVKLAPHSLGEPEILEVVQGAQSIPTAVTVYADDPGSGTPLEERTSIGFTRSSGGTIEESFLAFKSPDLSRHETRRGTELFVGKALWSLTGLGGQAKSIFPGFAVRWIFGVPSGWGPEVCEEYRELLAGLCGGDVQVVPESRAAMLYAQHSRDVPSGPGAGKSLVIDLGSSTADYTLVSGLVADAFTWDGGTPLGASLLDKEIMQRAIDAYKARPGVDPDFLDELLQDPDTRNFLEFSCRKAKEDFFISLPPASQLHLYAPLDKTVRLKNRHTGEEIKVELELTFELMEEILASPLAALGGRSWGEALRSDLALIRAALKGEMPASVVMTGGASRMLHAQQAVAEIFPESQLILGAEPQLAIAKGLAIVGRKQEQMAKFRAKVRQYVKGDDLPRLLDDSMKALAADLGKIMSEGLVEDYMIPATLKWRNGDLDTVAEIEGEVQRTYREFLQSPKVDSLIRSAVERWAAELTDAIDQKTRSICEEAGIPADTLSISHRPEYQKHAEVEGTVPQKMAVDLYDQIGNWMVGGLGAVATIVTLMASAVAFNAASLALAAAAASGTVATFWNPWLVTGLVALTAGGVVWGAFAGKEKIMEEIRTRKIHPRVRRVIKEDTLRGKVRSEAKKESLEAKVAEKIATKFLELNEKSIKEAFLAEVVDHLNDAADRAELLIRPSDRTITFDGASDEQQKDDPDES